MDMYLKVIIRKLDERIDEIESGLSLFQFKRFDNNQKPLIGLLAIKEILNQLIKNQNDIIKNIEELKKKSDLAPRSLYRKLVDWISKAVRAESSRRKENSTVN